jgi:predicted DNA-binding transcriptional regulator YafY
LGSGKYFSEVFLVTGETNEELLCRAIDEQKVVTFNYNWRYREIEPYLVGIHEDEDEPMVRCFQTDGESVSGGLPDWRLFRLRRMSNLEITDESFEPRRTQYKPTDPAMSSVICRI